MKKILCLISLLALLILTSNSFAKDFIVGEVIELSAGNKMIQLCDSLYKFDQVYLNNGVNPETKTLHTNIREGSVVQIYLGAKTSDYWLTEKVVVLTGIAKDHMIETYGIACDFQTNQDQDDD